MKPFFTPSAWDSNAEVIAFKSVAKNSESNNEKSSKLKKKAKKQKSKQTKEAQIATPTTKTVIATHKVKTGRIEKKNIIAKPKMQLSPSLAKAAAAALMEHDSGMDVDNLETTPSANTADTNPLTAKLKAELLGGRFRYLNEQLYTMNSSKAEKLFRQEKDAFNAYHDGYRHQVEKWPMNPLQRIIKTIKRLPKTLEIGDFGCGEGKLAESVPHKVHSMDLVSTRSDIIACDIANTPLAAQSLDVAVYCLSLMGTNLNDFFLEANRVLKLHGNVYIAEIQSRFEDAREFVRAMNACGFDLVKKDVAKNFFYFFQFKKMRHVGKVAKLKPFSLKPCLYRKR